MIDATMIDFISKVGFPMFVAVYFMITITKVLQQNTLAITELKSTNIQILNRLERIEEKEREDKKNAG